MGSCADNAPLCVSCYPRLCSLRYLESVGAKKEVGLVLFHSSIGLSPDQEEWLESVTHRNTSTTWPLLTSSQSAALFKNVRAFQNVTEITNYPYHQAGTYVDLVMCTEI